MLPLTIEEGHGEIRKSTGAPSSPGPMRYSSLSLKELVCLCAADPRDDDAWKEFVSRVNKPIALTIMRVFLRVLRVKPSLSLVQDLAQETYVKLLRHGCRRLRDFAIKHSDDGAILAYIRKTAANATHDCIRRYPPVPTIDIDPETEQKADKSQERTAYRVFLNEIDGHLKHCLTGPDRKRDRMIFWLYFLQGMSCKEIASLPTIGLTDKGVGAVIERLKKCLRERILRSRPDSEDDEE